MDIAKRIRSIAAQVSRAEDEQVPLLLLQLRDILNSSRLDARGQQSAIRLVWKCDLIHVLVGAVQRDSSQVQNGLETATQLAAVLATVCSGLRPKETHHHQQEQKGKVGEEREQVREFYNILLPTAVDSLLILANGLLEHASAIPPPTDTPTTPHASMSPSGAQPPLTHILQCFQSTLESLSLLCSSHKPCASRTLQSPYILHMIISNHPRYCRAVLIMIQNLLRADRQLFGSLPEDHLQSILDELTYRLSADEEEEVKVECLKLLAILVKCSPPLLACLCSKYKRLSSVVSQWKGCGLEGDVEQFILSIEAHGKGGDGGAADRAAVVIQASWRGYSERRRLRRVDGGIRRFQQLYRKRKAEQNQLKEVERHQQNVAAARHLESLSKMRSFHEKQLSTLERLPASDVGSFLQRQKVAAATRLQAWWRGRRCRRRYSQMRREARLEASAVTIQRAFRMFHKTKQQQKASHQGIIGYPLLEGKERELLQQKIDSRREEHPPPRLTEPQMRQAHDEVQSLLSQFCLRAPEQRREEEKRKVLYSRLEQDCALLLSAPKLCEATEEEVQKFVSGSHVVARMAQLAHREELRATELPWWKQPLSDTTGDIQL